MVDHDNTAGCSCVFLCVCVCSGAISTTSPLGEQEPDGGGGHRPAQVQPGLTLALDAVGGQRRSGGEEGTGGERT